MLPAAELVKLIPGLETGDLVSAAFEPEGGYADPHLTVTGYADAARRFRARIVQGCTVIGIRGSFVVKLLEWTHPGTAMTHQW